MGLRGSTWPPDDPIPVGGQAEADAVHARLEALETAPSRTRSAWRMNRLSPRYDPSGVGGVDSGVSVGIPPRAASKLDSLDKPRFLAPSPPPKSDCEYGSEARAAKSGLTRAADGRLSASPLKARKAPSRYPGEQVSKIELFPGFFQRCSPETRAPLQNQPVSRKESKMLTLAGWGLTEHVCQPRAEQHGQCAAVVGIAAELVDFGTDDGWGGMIQNGLILQDQPLLRIPRNSFGE